MEQADQEDGKGWSGEVDRRLTHLADLIVDSPHNLVSRAERSRERVLEAHLLEAARCAPALACGPHERWLDLGTGGGIPGLVLACIFERTEWVLVDSVGKKTDAVRGFVADLGLRNVSVQTGRAEALARRDGMRESFDGVVARALAPLRVVAELARGFAKPNGRLAAIKGPAWAREQTEARNALDVLGWTDIHSQRIASTTRETWLVTMRTTGPAPKWVPRRVGVPRARPL